MSVYISGLKIPQDGRVTLQIDSNGGVYVVNKFSIVSEKYEKSMTATEIQPHGRLGDLDALYEEISNGNKAYNGIEGYDGEYQHIGDVDDCLDVIKMEETVIEAEGSET